MGYMNQAGNFPDQVFFKSVNPAIGVSYPPHAFKQSELVLVFVMFVDQLGELIQIR